jgi:hypothetical protein
VDLGKLESYCLRGGLRYSFYPQTVLTNHQEPKSFSPPPNLSHAKGLKFKKKKKVVIWRTRMDALTSLFSLAGRTALVTGGTRGIGAQMAIALAEAGADIILLQVRCIDIYVPILQANQKKRERDLYGIHSHFARKTSQWHVYISYII